MDVTEMTLEMHTKIVHQYYLLMSSHTLQMAYWSEFFGEVQLFFQVDPLHTGFHQPGNDGRDFILYMKRQVR